ncbi:hypothetical protein [Allopusillimonas ginsengisoli]|uniref:hypothetical protein n=1 Tax=Allopusillimonas ginsengisoli TaxID=453575 RepID=UPI00101F5EF2|nr:hypothetical protein [Allopusillimonas ginsengisoli]TEA79143.1 hypothetical protein ERE07_07085 [Allopusillimonas ginsengisoli]
MAKTSLSPAALRAYRLEVASRSVLAALGGYGLAALSASSLGLILPLSPLQAALTATMLAFVLYCVFAIWVFCTATARRAWMGGLLLAAVPACHLLWAGASQ